jgi:SAM-dependent methyltransferase
VYEDRYVEVYDLLMRSRDKDYAAEAAEVARLVRERSPHAASLLDVACGTGLHLRYFAKLFDHVVGMDQSSDMLDFAGRRLPGLSLRCGDMRRFDAGESFDAITCMFAIPHLRSAAELDETVGCFARHLAPGGVMVIEQWFTPEQFIPGYVATDLIHDGARRIVRVSHTTRDPDRDDQVRMAVHYVAAAPEPGIEYWTESTDMTLFTHEQYETAFARAGCFAEYVAPGDLFARGLWIARLCGPRSGAGQFMGDRAGPVWFD